MCKHTINYAYNIHVQSLQSFSLIVTSSSERSTRSILARTGRADPPTHLEQVAKAVVKGVMRPDRKVKGFLRVKAK